MKVLFIALFVGFLAFSPVYLLNYYVLPQLSALSNVYSGYETTANEIANAR